MYFGTIWMTWASKKMQPKKLLQQKGIATHIYPIKPKWNTVYEKNFSRDSNILPICIENQIFLDTQLHFLGFFSITKLSQTSRKRYAQKMCGSANFDNLDKGLGIVSPSHFVYNLSTEMFLMLCPINWPNLIVWLSMCIAIVC